MSQETLKVVEDRIALELGRLFFVKTMLSAQVEALIAENAALKAKVDASEKPPAQPTEPAETPTS